MIYEYMYIKDIYTECCRWVRVCKLQPTTASQLRSIYKGIRFGEEQGIEEGKVLEDDDVNGEIM